MTRRKVVLAVTHESTALTFYRGYLAFLESRGWLVTVVASSTGKLESFAEEQNATGIGISMQRNPAPFKDLISLGRWITTLRRIRPDILVTATPKASLLGMAAGWLLGIPNRVYHMWGLRLETVHGPRKWVLQILEKLTVAMSTEVVCNSRSLADSAKHAGVLGRKIPVVLGEGSSHGIDTHHFSASADIPPIPESLRDFLNKHDSSIVFGFVGRIHPDKGLAELLSALQICVDQGQRIACIIVGGSEDEQLMNRLAQAQETLPLYLAGKTPDPRPYLKVFDVFCLPSKREGFPNVVLEAAAMEVPAIVADSTGTIDSVVDGETGLIVATGSPGDLARAMLDLAVNEELRIRLGRAARERVVRHFTNSRIWSLQEENLLSPFRTMNQPGRKSV